MSFGFAIGDVVAVGKLIFELTTCLQAVGGATEEYQELRRELQLLDAALRHLDRLDADTQSSTTIDSIKCAALSCRYPLEKFLTEIKKYDASLGISSQLSLTQSAKRRVHWHFGMKDEVKTLQRYLHTHIGTINILLAEHGLERLHLVETSASTFHKQVEAQLHTAQGFLATISNNITAQMLAVSDVQTMLSGLHQLVLGEIRASFEAFGQAVTQVCVSTQQIYTVVLEIRNSMPQAADTRWTYFQQPLLIEDALGRKFPVPSEYDFDLLHAVIQHKFKSGPGARHVSIGSYELCSSAKRVRVITAASPLLPGMTLTMAVILEVINSPITTITSCPMPQCRSSEAYSYMGESGWVCSLCGVWYSPVRDRDGRVVDLKGRRVKVRMYGEDGLEGLRNIKWVARAGGDSAWHCLSREFPGIREAAEAARVSVIFV